MATMADRMAWYGDPNFTDVPLADRLSDTYGRMRFELIGDRAATSLNPGQPGGRAPRCPDLGASERTLAASSIKFGVGEPTFADRFDRGSRAERKSAEIELIQAEMGDEFPKVAHEDVRRIVRRIVRLAARAMRPEVGHDHSEALARDPVRMAELDPVHLGVGEEAVHQDDRPALAQLMIGEFDAVGRGPSMKCGDAHG